MSQTGPSEGLLGESARLTKARPARAVMPEASDGQPGPAWVLVMGLPAGTAGQKSKIRIIMEFAFRTISPVPDISLCW